MFYSDAKKVRTALELAAAATNKCCSGVLLFADKWTGCFDAQAATVCFDDLQPEVAEVVRRSGDTNRGPLFRLNSADDNFP